MQIEYGVGVRLTKTVCANQAVVSRLDRIQQIISRATEQFDPRNDAIVD
ncbi:MAG: hypothetical protein H0V88_14675 [Pyrinomonadaceae bacterium]|nr:hypothetical protein [Pyrinomonadaceae bacterium]